MMTPKAPHCLSMGNSPSPWGMRARMVHLRPLLPQSSLDFLAVLQSSREPSIHVPGVLPQSISHMARRGTLGCVLGSPLVTRFQHNSPSPWEGIWPWHDPGGHMAHYPACTSPPPVQMEVVLACSDQGSTLQLPTQLPRSSTRQRPTGPGKQDCCTRPLSPRLSQGCPLVVPWLSPGCPPRVSP